MAAHALSLLLALGASGPAPLRVEPRLLAKEGHAFLAVGGTYLARGDYYLNPGLCAGGAYYFTEDTGLELRAGYLFSSMSAGGKEVFARTGLIPDARQPSAFLLAGVRHTVGYGKVLLGAEGLLHFDVQLFGDLGALRADGFLSPAATLGPGLLVRAASWLFLQADLGVSFSSEPRRAGWLTLGFVPTLTAGVAL